MESKLTLLLVRAPTFNPGKFAEDLYAIRGRAHHGCPRAFCISNETTMSYVTQKDSYDECLRFLTTGLEGTILEQIEVE